MGFRLENDLNTYSAHAGASDGSEVWPPASVPASDGGSDKGILLIMRVRIIWMQAQLEKEKLRRMEHDK